MNTGQAVTLAVDLLQVALQLTIQAQQINLLIQQARAAGRDLDETDWANIRAMDQEARSRLEQALAAQR